MTLVRAHRRIASEEFQQKEFSISFDEIVTATAHFWRIVLAMEIKMKADPDTRIEDFENVQGMANMCRQERAPFR